jgi:hypothetical protein
MDTAMTERDPFERDLGRMLAAKPAPDALRRQIGGIPDAHPRRARSPWRSWFDGATAPWAASMMAGFASLAIGIWLGASGLNLDNRNDTGGDDELTAMAFPGANLMEDDL